MISIRAVVLALACTAMALPITRREVPQEHSHEKFLISVRSTLAISNPNNLGDPVFALLGAAAAASGLGTQNKDTDCLQLEIADQAFTNAKTAGDVKGMTDALIYRTLERNSLSVGATTAACTSVQAVNPELANLNQHQDPASTDAAAVNKAITLELAKQIASIGGNPLDALESGTFAPGQLNDPTARGNSCNVLEDLEGCIFTQNLLVADATDEEITAAAGGAGGNDDAEEEAEAPVETPAPEAPAPAECPIPTTVTVTVDPTPTATEVAAPPPAATEAPAPAPPAAGGNLQTFTENLLGVVAPTVTANGNQFAVQGNASFNSLRSAVIRSCDVQNNQCANAANAAGAKEVNVADCNAQQAKCIANAPAN